MTKDIGVPAVGGRAGGLRPEPAAQSQPKALIPNALAWLSRPKPMLWARTFGWGLLIASLAGELRILGFHPAPQPQQFVALIGAAVLLAICRAHDSIVAAVARDSA